MWAFVAMLVLLGLAVFGMIRPTKRSGRTEGGDVPTGDGSFHAHSHAHSHGHDASAGGDSTGGD